MRGHIRQRAKDKKTWSVVIELNKVNGKRKQKWYTIHGDKKDAEKFLTEKLRELDTGTLIDSRNINIDEAFSNLYRDTKRYLSNKETSFEKEVHNKRLILGNCEVIQNE